MYAVREQKVIADGLEYTKRTEIIATNEGFVALEATTLAAQQQQQPRPAMLPAITDRFVALEATTLAAQQQPRPIVAPPSPPAITAGPPPVLIKTAPEPEPCCDYGCCECDDHFKWYSFAGKGNITLILKKYKTVRVSLSSDINTVGVRKTREKQA
ncbi:hypothetical protein AC249_AIPGENE3789 [Exaiptasia diaphana]|nr:hypothetical protein AC249_AIPGENE3789 [Exaiptasia diaphana]